MNNNLLAKTEDMYQYILICIFHSHKLENNPNGKMIISLYLNEIYTEFLQIFGNSIRFDGRIDERELFKECLIYLIHKENLKYDENILFELYKLYTLNTPFFSAKLLDYFKNVNLERFSQQSNQNSNSQSDFDSYIYNQFKEMVKTTIGVYALSNNSIISNKVDELIAITLILRKNLQNKVLSEEL